MVLSVGNNNQYRRVSLVTVREQCGQREGRVRAFKRQDRQEESTYWKGQEAQEVGERSVF